MNTLLHPTNLLTVFLLLLGSLIAAPTEALAHCDTMNGPVVLDAKKAIATDDVTPVLKWVAADDEPEIRASFERTMNVRAASEEVREMADMYFFETLVRLHRMSEGVGYTGLKPATAVEPAIAAADAALESGSVEELAELLTGAVQAALEERFEHAFQAKQHADESIEAGREFVKAYVLFTHLAEEVGALASGASHADTPSSSAASLDPH